MNTFKAISWGQFTSVVLLGLACYYTYIALTYYRAELLALVKGKAGADEPALVRPPSSLIGKNLLITKPAIAPPVASAEVLAPTAASTIAPTGGEQEQEEPAEECQGSDATEESQELGELPALDLPTAEDSDYLIDGKAIDYYLIDGKASNFTLQDSADSFQATDGGVESAPEEYGPGFTIGVAQLGNYFKRATEGQLTQDDIVEQEPALANTELLVSFFQASNKRAQRATAHLFAEVEEPALD